MKKRQIAGAALCAQIEGMKDRETAGAAEDGQIEGIQERKTDEMVESRQIWKMEEREAAERLKKGQTGETEELGGRWRGTEGSANGGGYRSRERRRGKLLEWRKARKLGKLRDGQLQKGWKVGKLGE